MTEKYFFEIPIFRKNYESYINETEAGVKKLENQYREQLQIEGYDYFSLAKRSFDKKFSNYRYGELVGMIRLFILGNSIRGELYFVREKVSKRLKNKNWFLSELKIFEILFFDHNTNEDIYNLIIKNIQRESKDRKDFKKNFIDLECFQNIGKYIDYKSLISSNIIKIWKE